jgi:hypothetical protein
MMQVLIKYGNIVQLLLKYGNIVPTTQTPNQWGCPVVFDTVF